MHIIDILAQHSVTLFLYFSNVQYSSVRNSSSMNASFSSTHRYDQVCRLYVENRAFVITREGKRNASEGDLTSTHTRLLGLETIQG